MKKTLFLSAMLGLALAPSWAVATSYNLPTDGSNLAVTNTNDRNLLLYNGTEGGVIEVDGDLALGSIKVWIGSGTGDGTLIQNRAANSALVKINGTVSNSPSAGSDPEIGFAEYGVEGNNAHAIYVLNGNFSGLQGHVYVTHGSGVKAYSQVVLGSNFTTGAYVQLEDLGNTVLHVAGNATIGGLKGGGGSGGNVTADNEATTLTLNVASGKEYTFQNSIGKWSYLTYADESYGSTQTSTKLNLTKQGDGTQTLSGQLSLGSLSVTAGTLKVTGTASIDSVTLSGGTLEISNNTTIGNSLTWTDGNLTTSKSLTFGTGLNIKKTLTVKDGAAVQFNDAFSASADVATFDIQNGSVMVKANNNAVMCNIKVGASGTLTLDYTGSNTLGSNNTHITEGGTIELKNGAGFRTEGITIIGTSDEATMTSTAEASSNKYSLTSDKFTLSNVQVNLGNKAALSNHLHGVDITMGTGDSALAITHQEGNTLGAVNATRDINFLSVGESTVTMQSLTLSDGKTVSAYIDATTDPGDNDANIANLTTSSLTVNGNATMNADLIVSGGTLTFADGAVLTMGCDVTIGDGVQVYITGDIAAIRGGEAVTIIDGLSAEDHISLGSAQIYVNNVYQSDFSLMTVSDENGMRIVVAPEPATATLSLLALAALAARRKRR